MTPECDIDKIHKQSLGGVCFQRTSQYEQETDDTWKHDSTTYVINPLFRKYEYLARNDLLLCTICPLFHIIYKKVGNLAA